MDLQQTRDRNSWYLIVEVFWAAILSAAATFNSTFAIRLGATNFDIGLLSSIPALIAILTSIPAGRFLQKHPRRKPWVVGSLALYRTGFLMIALIPFIPDNPISKGLLVVMVLIAVSPPAHFFNVSWIPLLAEVIPEFRRASIFAARNILANLTNSVFTFLFGILLVSIIFPYNFTTMYVIGWIGSIISCFYIWRMAIDDSPPDEPPSNGRRNLAQKFETIKSTFREHKSFTQIIINTFLHGFGLWAAGPLYVLRYIRELEAPDSWIGYLGTVTSLSAIVGMLFWRWWMPKIGETKTLKITILLVGVFPILVGFIPSLSPILLAIIFNGLISAGVNLSHFNVFLKTTPDKNRPGYIAIYITIMNIGAFLCPLAGVAVANWIGLAPTLILCGILSVLGSSSFIWAPVNPEIEVKTA